MNLSTVVNFHIEDLKGNGKLSEKTKNVCLENNLDTLYKILCYYLNHKNFLGLKNCGVKTNNELLNFCNHYSKDKNNKFYEIKDDQNLLTYEDFKVFCNKALKIPADITEKYKAQFTSRKFPFFTYLEHILDFVLNEREQYIFTNYYGFIEDTKKKTLQSIGNKYNITRERARQISKRVPEKIGNALQKINKRYSDFTTFLDYDIDLKKDFVDFNSDVVKHINTRENLNYSPKLYYVVFSHLSSSTFDAIQNFEDNYTHYYLVNKKYTSSFDFNKFINYTQETLNKRIVESQSYEIDFYLQPFLTQNQILNQRLKKVCKSIATSGLGVSFEKPNYFIFKRNSLVTLSEHILSILEEQGVPMNLMEISKSLRMRTEKTPTSVESLRSTILNIEQVKAIGKTSTYMLRSWQVEKTGTIKELVKEFLENAREPKHLNEITAYISKYRKTTDKNILSNLKLDKNKSFVFFKLGYIGLSYLQYKNIQLEAEKEVRKPRAKQKPYHDPNQLSLL